MIWHPIASAPKDGTVFLIFGPPNYHAVASWNGCWLIEDYYRGGSWDNEAIFEPSHWTELTVPNQE